ncbi:uncharacterized protein K489DRAFT_337070, partial [Dissoconium aciculare CBS 342.82]|uniref:Uncharacterized protein n=1 Tax=Dissoconium aciculare CBS 342.82 TaxID=1314786 RepID=A0A6J3M6L7_9PEZI
MADDETALSSPGSTGAANGTKASKDRACPFCGQAFTSSSLGRHLDLYIKPKNPKPADGVHDVDEIRKIRGGITRRQPRTSTKGANAGAGPGSNDGPNAANHDNSRRSESVATANWLTTGVINDLPPRSTTQTHADIHISGQAQRMQEMRRHVDGSKLPRPEYESESMSKLQEAAELGRAAEMALREVLGSLEAAQKRTKPTTLFEDFDFFSLSFPGLCLAVLPAPRTLFCVTPFPSADSWSIGPPGLRQFEALSKCLRVKAGASPRTDLVTDDMVVKHQSHLAATWEHWQTMSESEQTSTWNLEILRS